MKFAKLTASILTIATLCALTTSDVSAAPSRRHAKVDCTYSVCTYADCDSTGIHQHDDCTYIGRDSDNTCVNPGSGRHGGGRGHGNGHGRNRHH